MKDAKKVVVLGNAFLPTFYRFRWAKKACPPYTAPTQTAQSSFSLVQQTAQSYLFYLIDWNNQHVTGKWWVQEPYFSV